MRIVVNSRFLTQPITGVQRYAIEISLLIRKVYSDQELIFLSPKSIIHNEISSKLKAKPIGNYNGHLWEQIDLPRSLEKDDLLINFCNTAPLFYQNKIITIHDLGFLSKEKWHSSTFRLLYRLMIPQIIRTSKRIITVSECTKLELTKTYNLNKDKIAVIHSAVSPQMKSYKPIKSEENFVLFVGSLDPRKNLKTIIDAFRFIPIEDIKLKIAGGFHSSFKKESLDSDKNQRIQFLGRVTDEELISLYSNALAFVYPSFYEGFGLPILEAMENNCAVIASDIPVFKEIFDDCVIYVDPHNAESIANAILSIYKSKDLINKIKEKGTAKAKEYSFTKSSNQLLELLNDFFCINN